jgi:hypothetical protein
MRSFKVSTAIACCVLAFSAGVAFADDLHKQPTSTSTLMANPAAGTGAPGQTGSNFLSSCGATSTLPVPYYSIGSVNPSGSPEGPGVPKVTSGMNSPFNPGATKTYAGNTGNPATNPKAVSQYDNACAQAYLHQLP